MLVFWWVWCSCVFLCIFFVRLFVWFLFLSVCSALRWFQHLFDHILKIEQPRLFSWMAAYYQLLPFFTYCFFLIYGQREIAIRLNVPNHLTLRNIASSEIRTNDPSITNSMLSLLGKLEELIHKKAYIAFYIAL